MGGKCFHRESTLDLDLTKVTLYQLSYRSILVSPRHISHHMISTGTPMIHVDVATLVLGCVSADTHEGAVWRPQPLPCLSIRGAELIDKNHVHRAPQPPGNHYLHCPSMLHLKHGSRARTVDDQSGGCLEKLTHGKTMINILVVLNTSGSSCVTGSTMCTA
jgi:hypothetical protein